MANNGPLFITSRGNSVLLSASSATAVMIPFTSNGKKTRTIRLSIDQGTAHVRLAQTASTNPASTGDTIISANEAIIFNTIGMDAVSALQTGGNPAIRFQISPFEDPIT